MNFLIVVFAACLIVWSVDADLITDDKPCNVNNNHRVIWGWLGALTSDKVEFKLRIKPSSDEDINIRPENVYVLLTKQFNTSSHPLIFHAKSVSEFYIAHVLVQNLTSDTEYKYTAWHGYEPYYNYSKSAILYKDYAIHGRFRTAPLEGIPANFSFGFASCADNKSNSVIFDVIREKQPLMFVHTGDLHYGNIEINEKSAFHYMYDTVFESNRQARFFQNVPLVYMFDDHDYGANNAERNSPSRNASISAFLEAVPHYPLAAYSSGHSPQKRNDFYGPGHAQQNSSVHFAFTIARVRFIVTDTSSCKESSSLNGPTALGLKQLKWLTDELVLAAQKYELIFWVNTMPWVVTCDKWALFDEERKQIAETIIRENIFMKLIMLSGDAHMLALDDGSNVLGSFPVFQAAALDAKPTCKGGPYSHGIFPGRGQYGWIDVRDDGHCVCINFSGLRVDNRTGKETRLLKFDTCDSSNNSLPAPYIPSPKWVQLSWKYTKKYILPRIIWGDYVVTYFDSSTFSLFMALKSSIVITFMMVTTFFLGLVIRKKISGSHGRPRSRTEVLL